ncbi:coiled-coil domain-containing protein 55-domain containing protein [Cercophora newfieldiana]|uniref:Coiled-coil domain-containing protein 55-domain containing protein n=1 Tax=Cercophora newfieldiana TaxID=92897 RepID=A0AA39Y5S3_9PEZI|nr:coiled-coil domain-containing protein 55-domain containing protein [Cercophora newfieldiana]
MSKPAFSFGLKKSAPSKPAPAKRKPATFGDASDDDDDDRLSRKPGANGKTTTISELDTFDSPSPDTPTTTAGKPKPKLRAGAPPPAPPTKAKLKAQNSALFGDLSSALDSRKYADAAEDADPSIYDYDGVYDSLKAAMHAKKKAEEEEGPAEKKPRYFDALQRAADVRERDRQIAEEKRLKRERDAEGDEFADKEKFVTEAYKRQQEENRRLEEAEKLREEAEAKKNKNRGLADFYKQMLDKSEEEHAAMVKAAEEGKGKEANEEVNGEKEKSATDRAREINAMGGNVVINDDGEVVDKRQLLKGGLNVTAKKVEIQKDKVRQTAHGSSPVGIPSRGVFKAGGKNAMRERQTRLLEAQLEETLKRSREEEEQEQAKVELVAKSRKTEADISSAKERYLARKRAAEEAKKNGATES